MTDRNPVLSIYDEVYAADYPSLYIAPWRNKHEINIANLSRLLAEMSGPGPLWLDLACGQAWHFTAIPDQVRKIGLDLSAAQLTRARANTPEATFVRADMSVPPFRARTFDLVTNFWAAYCYLGSTARIESFLNTSIALVREGGALYFEVLLPKDLESFNRSHFAERTAFSVTPLTSDYTEWSYEDSGGRHVMTSPPLEVFLAPLSAHFEAVEADHDGAFMVHVIARHRKA